MSYARNLMVDIETMSISAANALVLSAAAVAFNINAGIPELGSERLWVFDTNEQLLHRRVDASTQEFWRGQPATARKHWQTAVTHFTVREFRNALCDWYDALKTENGEKDLAIWANGCAFDITNIETLLEIIGAKVPWAYNSVRDARTIYKVIPELIGAGPMPPVNANLHDPVADCKDQIARLARHLFDV